MKNYKFIKKKGFTIVELVIVIGVIGILSAILIPTFISISDKAKKSNDQALIRNLNNAVAIGKADGQSFDTFGSALEYVEDYGYNARNIKPQAGGEILWDTTIQDFVLIENIATITDGYKYFKVYESIPELDEQFFSIYLSNSELTLDDVTVKVGFDAGKNTNINAITYEQNIEEHEVIIRTLGECDIHINAPQDKVHHYGDSKYTYIDEISSSSFYEYGTSEFTTITSGRIIIYPESEVDGIYVKGNDAIIAKTIEASFPKITRNDAVNSTSIQIVDDRGNILNESIVSISESTITPEGDVPEGIIEDACSDLDIPVDENTEKMATKYVMRVGAAVEGDESNYFHSIEEAVESILSASSAKTLYLLKDLVVDEAITLTGKATKVPTINLQGHSITGNGCSPLNVKMASSLTISNGSLIGDGEHPGIIFESATASIYITMTNVDTVGGINNICTSTGYIRLNGGKHTLNYLTGRVLICVASSTTYFDNDPSSHLNTFRCKLTQESGLYKVTRKTQSTSNHILSTSDGFTRYASITEALQNDDFPAVALRLLTNITEDVVVSTSKTLTLYTGTTSKNSNKYTFTGSVQTSGNLSLGYGTFNLTDIKIKTLTVNASCTVNLNSGNMSAIAVKGSATSGYDGTLNMYGGTNAGKLTYYKANYSHTNIYGGRFNGNLTVSGSGSKFTVKVMGGTYKNSTVYNTFKTYLQEGYKMVTNADGTRSVVADE